MRAVRFHEYGGATVLQLEDISTPAIEVDQVLVRVVAAATNILDIALREGQMGDAFPGTLPSGQGFDLAGTIVEIGADITDFVVGDDVIGWAPRRAQADYVAVDARELARKPGAVSWAAAASIPTAAATAYGAVHAVDPQPGDTVVVSAAAGGVGALVTQLVINAGATVIGTAGPANFEFLRGLGATPVGHGDGLIDRITNAAPNGVTAYLDNYGEGNVEVALRLGVKPDRINTIIDFAAVQQYGVHAAGQAEGNDGRIFAELAHLVADNKLTIPIQSTYPVEQVRTAYEELSRRHARGKIVLEFDPKS
jgi:NADPH:quinone reductase-like Zn-dependent oxidoreductase